jgi:undecaprenyl diphosphate synthase
MTPEFLVPKHLGIIMDGNGRWAQQKGFNRSRGHKEGLTTAKKIVKEAARLSIPYVSLYVFSTENWKRTEEEVSYLMYLLKNYLRKEYQFYVDNQIRVVHSGDIFSLPMEIQNEINYVVDATSDFTGLTVNLLINYGGQDELIRAIKKFYSNNENINELSTENIYAYLDQPDVPSLDLIIRTAGEQRLSNFLLWQSAYSEFYYCNTLWPDFSEKDLRLALEAYSIRKRKYGGVS